MLEKENYTIKTLNLLTSGKIPEDAAAVIASMGPAKPFQPCGGGPFKRLPSKGRKAGSLLRLTPWSSRGLIHC